MTACGDQMTMYNEPTRRGLDYIYDIDFFPFCIQGDDVTHQSVVGSVAKASYFIGKLLTA